MREMERDGERKRERERWKDRLEWVRALSGIDNDNAMGLKNRKKD